MFECCSFLLCGGCAILPKINKCPNCISSRLVIYDPIEESSTLKWVEGKYCESECEKTVNMRFLIVDSLFNRRCSAFDRVH